MVIYFDTETTGLKPGRVIQLSYIIDDGATFKGKNFFFAVDYIPIESTMVHGFTVEKIYTLSGGKTFGDFADEIYSDFSSAKLIVGHNVMFDIGFLAAEFARLGRSFDYENSLDTMKYFTAVMKLPRKNGSGFKFPKLSETTEFFSLSESDVAAETKYVFRSGDIGFHDARYDTTAVMLIFKADAFQGGELKKVYAEALNGTS